MSQHILLLMLCILPILADFQAPWISCPNNVIVVLSTGANTADVSALLGSPTSNYPDRITLTPEQYNTNKIFPAGETLLTYTATNPNNEVASCIVRVIVQGIVLGYIHTNMHSR